VIKDPLICWLLREGEKCVKSPANELEKESNEQFERGELTTKFQEAIKKKKSEKV
jgi:hypothetical protein